MPGADRLHLPGGTAPQARGWMPHRGPPEGKLLKSLLLLTLTVPLDPNSPRESEKAPREWTVTSRKAIIKLIL